MSSPMNETSMQGSQANMQGTSQSTDPSGSMESGFEHHNNPFKHPHDSCEAEPGLIESTDLAPLNHEVVAPDHPSMMNKGQQSQSQTSRTSKKM